MTSAPRPALSHVIWDWNGTLFDDFDLTAVVAARTMERMGQPGVTAEHIRDSFRRPFSEFYARLLGRPVTAEEFTFIRRHYESGYDAEVLTQLLQPDASAALDLLEASGASQSLLSMAHDGQLQQLVDHHDIRSRFVRIEGSPTTDSDGNKAARMGRHLQAMGVDPTATVAIGDTVDDHEAAQANGARSVLVTTGSTSRSQLEATGAPVVDTLLAAATLSLESS